MRRSITPQNLRVEENGRHESMNVENNFDIEAEMDAAFVGGRPPKFDDNEMSLIFATSLSFLCGKDQSENQQLTTSSSSLSSSSSPPPKEKTISIQEKIKASVESILLKNMVCNYYYLFNQSIN